MLKYTHAGIIAMSMCALFVFANSIQSAPQADDSSCAKIEDLQQIVQSAIDFPPLDEYYHAEELPSRKPLVITGKSIPTTLILKKFGQKVEVIPQKKVMNKRAKAYLKFTRVVIRKTYAEVTFSYPIEGIRVHLRLQKQSKAWKIVSSHLVET